MVEYLDPSIANEGLSANNWQPGAWTNAPAPEDEEYQPDFEAPHINDYAAFKKHKHYAQYFKPYRYRPFPAVMYHKTLGEKIVKSKEEVEVLGPEWSPTPNKPRVDMTGKSLPVKSETQRLAEVVAQAMGKQGSSTDAIPAIVAAVMAAVAQQQGQSVKIAQSAPEVAAETPVDEDIERTALLELADTNNVKVDGRWSNKRLKEELGL